jgi:hypothetical protein
LPVHYRRVRTLAGSARGEGFGHRLHGVLSPALGSRRVFPDYFNRAVARLLGHGRAAAVPPSHARWYFGERLLLDVDPAGLTARISDYVEDGHGPRWMGAYFLDAADWRHVVAPLARSPIHIEMYELIAADLRFRETDRYRLQVGRVARGKPIMRNGMALASIADVDAYWAYCVDLVKSVRDHGLLRRGELDAAGRTWLKHRTVRPVGIDAAERDIGVAVTAEGDLIRHLGGKHRTAIAQALGFASIPVELRLVHVGWLAREMRDRRLSAHIAVAEGAARLASARAGQRAATSALIAAQ